jgi:transcriptional regulator with XRE-family HTH domain
MSKREGENLRRLIANFGLTIEQVVARTGVDRRTILGILEGATTPHVRTLKRLAEGLGVPADEFFLDPTQLLYRRFDQETNPRVAEVVQAHPDLFEDWTDLEFDELHSRFGTGGPLTTEGALEAVREMNGKRRLHEKLALLLESSQAVLIRSIVELLYNQIVVKQEGEVSTPGRDGPGDFRNGPQPA